MAARKRSTLRAVGGAALLAAALFAGAGCAAGPKVPLDPESRAFYETARLIMTGEEQKIFNRLPDEAARRAFIRDFWDKRDPDPLTEVNEFKREFEARVDYASKRFREGGPGWNTDRGRIYIYMGPPDKVEESFTHGIENIRGSIIWWVYYKYELAIEFADERGMREYKIRRYEGSFFEAMDLVKLGQAVEGSDAFRKRRVEFNLAYDGPSRSLVVSIAADALSFKEEDGKLSASLSFTFYLYQAEGSWTHKFSADRTLALAKEDLAAGKILDASFPVDLAPGDFYADVIIRGGEGASGKIRKIFEFKVS
ncbi:MAG: GWxTD domain-containing protein [Candidatus Aminicenantes bacterium]|nr:GWxTD domain-containing protein [Candidatus Aminicenantes bacterium]